jgi:hypothetical protein
MVVTDIPEHLVEKARHDPTVVEAISRPRVWRDPESMIRAVLAAVWDDLPAARPVVDAERLAKALWERLGFPTEREWEELPSDARDDWRGDADAVLASGVVQDAADVRRGVADRIEVMPVPEFEYAMQDSAYRRAKADAARFAREVGERDG